MYPDGAAVLAFVGITSPTDDETAWADAVAKAVEHGISVKLNGPVVDPEGQQELEVAAMLACAEAYKRREATFGLTGYADMQGEAIRVARDYLDGVAPLILRYGNGPGIG